MTIQRQQALLLHSTQQTQVQNERACSMLVAVYKSLLTKAAHLIPVLRSKGQRRINSRSLSIVLTRVLLL